MKRFVAFNKIKLGSISLEIYLPVMMREVSGFFFIYWEYLFVLEENNKKFALVNKNSILKSRVCILPVYFLFTISWIISSGQIKYIKTKFLFFFFPWINCYIKNNIKCFFHNFSRFHRFVFYLFDFYLYILIQDLIHNYLFDKTKTKLKTHQH